MDYCGFIKIELVKSDKKTAEFSTDTHCFFSKFFWTELFDNDKIKINKES